jgi:hypothetical protein
MIASVVDASRFAHLGFLALALAAFGLFGLPGDAVGYLDAAPPTADQVVVTDRALAHIHQRHWPDSDAPGAGKYSPGITDDALRSMIHETVQNGRVRRNTNGRPGWLFEYNFHHQIGTTIDGGPANRLRVVVNSRDEVITAFPY